MNTSMFRVASAIGDTPEAFATFAHGEARKWASVVKAAGIKPQ